MARVLEWLPILLGLYSLAVGIAAIAGWAADIPRLTDWDSDGISMQPNTGLASALVGVALIGAAAGRRRGAAGLGAIALALGSATLFEHLANIDLGIDSLLLFGRTWGSRGTVTPGRMGIPSSFAWTLAGVALIALRRPGKTPLVVPIVGLALTAVASLSLAGYLFGADLLFTLPRLTAIALQTATTTLATGVALLLLASDRQPVSVLTEDSSAGALARLALPVVIVLPLVIGYLCVVGHRAGLYDASMGVALLVLLLVSALSAVLWWGVQAVAAREQSLRRSEDRFSRFMQHLPGLAWIKDADGRYLYVNDAAARAFQRLPEQLYGRVDDDIFPPETAAQFRGHDGEVLRTGRGMQVIETLKQADGVDHHSVVSKFPIPAEDDAGICVGGMAIDITERKRAEEAVRSLLVLSERLNSTLDVEGLLEILIKEAIALADAESGVSGVLTGEGMVCQQYIQKGQTVPLSYCWPPMHGLPGWLIVHKKPYVTNDAASDPQIVQELCRQFGVWSALSTPILSAQGNLLGFFEVHNKINGRGFTEADQELLVAVSQIAAIAVQNALAYRALDQARDELKTADRRKDEFLAVLAHELRNPLAPIRTGLEIIKRAGSDTSLIDAAQQAMERQVRHLVRLVDDLLDLSRISQDKLELRNQRIELAAVVRQAVETSEPLLGAQNQQIELQLPQVPVFLEADAVRLSQVFSNLLNNACKFSPPGSQIRLTARREGSDAVVSVRDQGIGIPPDKLNQVFEMFTQVHQSFDRSRAGLGIGLTLVRRLVEMHGGSVTAQSDGDGQGSEFVVRLPLLVQPPAAPVTQNPLSTEPTGAGCVLVVDDNFDAASTLAALLRLAGYETVLAHDGEEACAVAGRCQPKIVLLDIGLPKRNGYEVCRVLRQQPWAAETVIVALTGWGQDDDRRQSAAAGFDGHLVKPVDYTLLVETLSNLIPLKA